MRYRWRITLLTLWSGLIWGINWLLQFLPQWLQTMAGSVTALEPVRQAATQAALWPEGMFPIPTEWINWAIAIYPMLLPLVSALLWVVWGVGALLLWGLLPRLMHRRREP